MATKSGVSKRTRFEVFKRDGFKCLYCGTTPHSQALHVDHVVPKAHGGTNDPSNLVTACADCNLGKSDVPLQRKRLASGLATEAEADHAEQILEYLKVQREIETSRRDVVDAIADQWEHTIGGLSQEMYGRLRGLIKQWPIEKLYEAMEITGNKWNTVGEEFDSRLATIQARYFYGVLRRWREGEQQ